MNRQISGHYLMVITLIFVNNPTRINCKKSYNTTYNCDLDNWKDYPFDSSKHNLLSSSGDILTWYNLSSKYFLAASAHPTPIFLHDSIYDAPCSVPNYKQFSPMAYLQSTSHTPTTGTSGGLTDEEHYMKIVERLRAYEYHVRSINPTEAKKYQQDICYREGEYLECFEGKCVCPRSGNFKKLKYNRGLYVDSWTGIETPKTVHCVSTFGAYCVRNSRSCLGGGKCISYGAVRPWPWTCVTGTCKENADASNVKSSFLGL